jgi:crenactin
LTDSTKGYREIFTFGEDYGTSDYKFGPASLGDSPDVVENRGYFPDNSASTYNVFTKIAPKELVVGSEVSESLEARQDLGEPLPVCCKRNPK